MKKIKGLNKVINGIGKKLEELRLRKNVSLTELSRMSGIQLATLSRIENGKMTGTVETYAKIADTFGMSLSEFFQDIETGAKMKKIFICSNDESLRETMKTILSDKHELILYEDMKTFPEIAKNAEIKMYFLDIDNQENIFPYLQKVSLKPAPIYIISSKNTMKTAKEMIGKAAKGYIEKPISPEAILPLAASAA